MDRIRSRLGRRADDPTSSPPSFSRGNAGLDLEFGDCIRRRIDTDLTELAFIVVGAVQSKVVIRRTRAVDDED